MKTIIIKEINSDSYTVLDEFLSKDIDENKWVILDSWWWSCPYGSLMIRRLEQHKDNVTLICWTWAYSSAFKIFYKFSGKKMMVYWCMWMHHKAHQEILMNEDWKPTHQDWFATLRNNKKTQSTPYGFMTTREVKQFNKWEDVFFDFDRMKEIFPDVEVIV